MEYQVRCHAQALERWFDPAEAERQAREAVEAGECWWYYEPPPAGWQLRLFD